MKALLVLLVLMVSAALGEEYATFTAETTVRFTRLQDNDISSLPANAPSLTATFRKGDVVSLEGTGVQEIRVSVLQGFLGAGVPAALLRAGGTKQEAAATNDRIRDDLAKRTANLLVWMKGATATYAPPKWKTERDANKAAARARQALEEKDPVKLARELENLRK
jgi:hypothetical protein